MPTNKSQTSNKTPEITHVTTPSTPPITTVSTPSLDESIDELTLTFKKRTSLGYRFLSGVATGIGTVIGATVLAGLVIYILSTILHKLHLTDIPIINDLIQQTDLSSLETQLDEKN